MKLPKIIGKIIYILTWPGIWLILMGSTRAYVAIIVKDELLVIQNWLGLHNKWRLPGGGVHKNEAPKQALVREVYEEIGIKINASDIRALNQRPITSKFSFKYYIYTVELPKKPIIKLNQTEIADQTWLNYKKIDPDLCGEELAMTLRKLL